MKHTIVLRLLSALVVVTLCQSETTDRPCKLSLADIHEECFFGKFDMQVYRFFWGGQYSIYQICKNPKQLSCQLTFNRMVQSGSNRECMQDSQFLNDYTVWTNEINGAVTYLCSNYNGADVNCMYEKIKGASRCLAGKGLEESEDNARDRVCESLDDLDDCYDDQEECNRNGETILKELLKSLTPAYCSATSNMVNLFLILAALSITFFVSK